MLFKSGFVSSSTKEVRFSRYALRKFRRPNASSGVMSKVIPDMCLRMRPVSSMRKRYLPMIASSFGSLFMWCTYLALTRLYVIMLYELVEVIEVYINIGCNHYTL